MSDLQLEPGSPEYMEASQKMADILVYIRQLEADNKRLREATRQRDELASCLQHALELGHLGDGSTAGWANKLIKSLKAQ